MTIIVKPIASDPNANPPTVTLGFDPVPGATGYVLYANGKRVSNTWDPLKRTWKVAAGHDPYRVVAVSPLDAGEYPAADSTETVVPSWAVTIQPNNHETSKDNYSFGWVKAKRNGIPGNSQSAKEGRIPFDLYPNGFWQVFARVPTNTPVGRTANWHVSPWPDGWSDEVSPYAWDWKPGAEWEGASGLVGVLEAATKPTHYSLVPEATWKKGGVWWFVTHTVPGRPGRARVWALDPNMRGSLVLDLRKSTVWPSDTELLFWNGGYVSNSDAMSSEGTIWVTLDGLGGSLDAALADRPVVGDILTSKGTKPSTVTEATPLMRPDSLIRAMVAA